MAARGAKTRTHAFLRARRAAQAATGSAASHSIVRVFRNPGLSAAKTAALLAKARERQTNKPRGRAVTVAVPTSRALTRSRCPPRAVQVQKLISPDIKSIDTELVRRCLPRAARQAADFLR